MTNCECCNWIIITGMPENITQAFYMITKWWLSTFSKMHDFLSKLAIDSLGETWINGEDIKFTTYFIVSSKSSKDDLLVNIQLCNKRIWDMRARVSINFDWFLRADMMRKRYFKTWYFFMYLYMYMYLSMIQKYPKCPRIYLPNLSIKAQKFWISIKKASLDVRSPCQEW